MNQKLHKILLASAIIFKLIYPSISNAEPYIILKYSNEEVSGSDGEGNFDNNDNFSTSHIIKNNETLSNIIEKYYSRGNFNLKFVQSAIVHKNRHAFVRANPNFMFAGKRLHLPSINEIKNLVYKNTKRSENFEHNNNKEIYFFGN